MKDETKEINIKFPGQILDYVDTKEHLLELFNYITNLQEVKFTEDYKDAYETTMIGNKMLEEKYIDYKSRIDKAIEFIDKYCIDDEFYVNLSYKEKAIIEVKNILTGDDSNE